MTELIPENLLLAAKRLIDEIGELSRIEDSLELQRLEHAARGLCAQLKAIEALDVYNLGLAARETEQTYTRYDNNAAAYPGS